MTTTQLFAELLIIGIGSTIWFSLLLAAIFGYRFDTEIIKGNVLSVLLLVGLSYVLGIVTDRLTRDLFDSTDKENKEKQFKVLEVNNVDEIENYIQVNYERLGNQIQYNRSRLRICRSWIINFLLINIAFTLWNIRVKYFDLYQWLALFALGIILCILTTLVTKKLYIDYYNNLIKSYNYAQKYSSINISNNKDDEQKC
jgi:uncharacterized membrane protein